MMMMMTMDRRIAHKKGASVIVLVYVMARFLLFSNAALHIKHPGSMKLIAIGIWRSISL